MGCADSKLNGSQRRGTFRGRRNTVVTKPNVNINIGTGINLKKDKKTKVIFIFGGPGSGKGTIVNNLVDAYNFKFVCGEDVILENLSEKLLTDNEVGSAATYKLQTLLAEDSSHLTLNWVLQLIEKEVEKYADQTVLIDIVPNLKFLLRVPTFSKCCEKEMKDFEEKYPVLLAIDLALDQDHLIQNINQTHACTKSPVNGPKDDKGNSDEMDTSRTQRRFNIYINSVKEFLQYFERDGKLLTVDTSCGNFDAVWDSVSNYVVESELATPVKGLEQVVLFKMTDEDFADTDRDRYPMLDVLIKNVVNNYAELPPGTLLKRLRLLLRENVDSKVFLVDVRGSKLCDLKSFEEEGPPTLLFQECEVGQLDFFMHGLKRRTYRKKSLVRKQAQNFTSITTLDNEALLFCQHVDHDLCRKIGLVYTQSE